MQRVVSIILTIIALLVLAAITSAYVSLSSEQGRLNGEVAKLDLELRAEARKYTRCYYSVNNGSYVVADVSISHLRYDSTSTEKAQLNKIETDFMTGVKKQCDGVIASYESKHAEYQKKLEETANAGWVAFLVGGSQVDSDRIESLEVIRFKTGDALSYFIFKREDVEAYFDKRLAQ